MRFEPDFQVFNKRNTCFKSSGTFHYFSTF